MPLSKPKGELRIAIFLPAYKRPEYTLLCVDSLVKAQEYPNCSFYLVDDGSNDGTAEIFDNCTLPNKTLIVDSENKGLRHRQVDFFDFVNAGSFDIVAKVDNDCMVPENWLNDILEVFCSSDVDILSPNVYPSNAAEKYGQYVEGLPYRPAATVGGLWVMKAELLRDCLFKRHEICGLKGAVALLRQIVYMHSPVIGWVPSVVVQDIGHWSGMHPYCIKNQEHEQYYREVGREIAWSA